MQRDSFVFYRSFFEALKNLNLNERLLAYDSICHYALDGKQIELSGINEVIFTLIKPQIEANNQKFMNGLKGGRPSKSSGLQSEKPNDNANENDKVNVNANNNENTNVINLFVELLGKEVVNDNLGLVIEWINRYEYQEIINALEAAKQSNSMSMSFIERLLAYEY